MSTRKSGGLFGRHGGCFIAASLLLAGCATGPRVGKTDAVNVGAVRIYASHVNLGYTSWFSGALNAVSMDGQASLAERLNDQIAMTGLRVEPGQEPATYRLREVFAGNARDYALAKEGHVAPKLNAITSLALGAVTCSLLNSCGDVGVLSNEVLSDLNGVSEGIGSQTAPTGMTVADETRIVATEVCAKRGCARSIALTDDRDVSLETLRQVNIDEGIMRAINLKK